MKPFLIYGANGYSGELIAREAVKRGLRPVLAGRNETPLAMLAQELDLEHRVCSLDRPDQLITALQDIHVVLNCAGPFMHTAQLMVNTCLQTKTHYLDITGEYAVIEALAARDADANGQADDTAAFQRALREAAGKTILVPAGDFHQCGKALVARNSFSREQRGASGN